MDLPEEMKARHPKLMEEYNEDMAKFQETFNVICSMHQAAWKENIEPRDKVKQMKLTDITKKDNILSHSDDEVGQSPRQRPVSRLRQKLEEKKLFPKNLARKNLLADSPVKELVKKKSKKMSTEEAIKAVEGGQLWWEVTTDMKSEDY